MVTEVLYEPDANDTLQINVGKWDGHDFLARNWNTNGIFSVKSAYKLRRYEHFMISMDNWGGFSSNVENHKGLAETVEYECSRKNEDPCLAYRPEKCGCGRRTGQEENKIHCEVPLEMNHLLTVFGPMACGYVKEVWMELEQLYNK